MNIKVGDGIKVKKGTKDPDFEDLLIEDWTGKVVEIIEEYDDENIALISIKWDNSTLQKLPKKYVKECENLGLDWECMSLYVSDIELTSSDDEKPNMNQILLRLLGKSNIIAPNRYENKLKVIFQGVDIKNQWDCLMAWERHLKDNLKFPFEAKLTPNGNTWKHKQNKELIISKISSVDDKYGVIVGGKINNHEMDFPVSDIELLDSKSTNFEIIQDYNLWFSNR